MTGTTTSGRVQGLNWIKKVTDLAGASEPYYLFEFDITFDGDVATGWVRHTYRLARRCEVNEVSWGYETTLTGQRVK